MGDFRAVNGRKILAPLHVIFPGRIDCHYYGFIQSEKQRCSSFSSQYEGTKMKTMCKATCGNE